MQLCGHPNFGEKCHLFHTHGSLVLRHPWDPMWQNLGEISAVKVCSNTVYSTWSRLTSPLLTSSNGSWWDSMQLMAPKHIVLRILNTSANPLLKLYYVQSSSFTLSLTAFIKRRSRFIITVVKELVVPPKWHIMSSPPTSWACGLQPNVM